MSIFSNPSVLSFVLGAQKNETVLLSTRQHMSGLRNKNINFYFQRSDLVCLYSNHTCYFCTHVLIHGDNGDCKNTDDLFKCLRCEMR